MRLRLILRKQLGRDAKTHLNARLKRVSRGEPIAMLPVKERDQPDISQLVREIRELRNGASLGKARIRELIDDTAVN